MWQEILRKLFETSRWRIIGASVGLVVGILFLLLGFSGRCSCCFASAWVFTSVTKWMQGKIWWICWTTCCLRTINKRSLPII